ncbi:MAG: hypothetical protein BWY40_00413 [bacterium ADurb.Bin270]|nr:MAG: hypothetical protein BWY40_00413 [bacterium ADurb.Bin270]
MKSCLIFESSAETAVDIPKPLKLSSLTEALNMNFSTDENPAPTLKLLVDLSLTVTLRIIVSSLLPLGVAKLTSSKKPSLMRFSLLRLTSRSLYLSFSLIIISRRITLSRVLVFP